MTKEQIKIIECPRDAMQGLKEFIPTEKKIAYLQALLKVGYDTIDCGSFVSPKAIPQMADTAEVIRSLDLSETQTKLSVIVANKRGALEASEFPQVNCLGFPFSISETFQLRNTNSTIEKALDRVKAIREITARKNKEFVVYLSMAFGNPYNDPWSLDIIEHWISELSKLGIRHISLSDTIGVAGPDELTYCFEELCPVFEEIEFGAHLHTHPHNWRPKVEASFKNGCKRFDGAIRGFGGCPMAKDELVGNMPTENLIAYFEENNIPTGLDKAAFAEAQKMALEVFPV
ncbi:MAG: hydroxymethylglutaryl-CoA lyase [Chitinophagales bacterium]